MAHQHTRRERKFPHDLDKARRLLARIESYTTKLKTHISELEAPILAKQERREKKKYLTYWYTSAFKEDTTFLKFFLKHANENNFRIERGYYVNDQSHRIARATSKWLSSRGVRTLHRYLYSCEIYHDLEMCGGYSWVGIRADNLQEHFKVLKISTLKKKLRKFKKEERGDSDYYANPSDLIFNLTDYIHCKACPEILWEADNEYTYVTDGKIFRW